MKKLILWTLAAASMLLAGSCQKHTADEDMSMVAFTIDVPLEIGTKTIGDGKSVDNVRYGVFDQNGNYIESLAQTGDLQIRDRKASFNCRLVRNYTYTIVCWAQDKDAPYTFDPKTTEVKVSYKGVANDENRDAFCAAHTFTVPDSPVYSETIYLKRPFAQINFGAADYAQVAELGLAMTSKVTIKGLADTYNILAGTVSGDAEAVTELDLNTVPAQFKPAEKLFVKGNEYGYVSMNYILAPVNDYNEDGSVKIAQSELANVVAEFVYNKKTITVDVPNVPFQRNFRTNIVGSFFTNQSSFNIIVDENFYTPDNYKEF